MKCNANFSNGLSTIVCPICKDETTTDSEYHAFNCEKMRVLIPKIINNKFMNIYSNDVIVMKDCMQVMTEILDLRRQILEWKNQ